jgi:hypothetical protein
MDATHIVGFDETICAGELRLYCFMVNRGKPAASMALQDRHVQEATRIATDELGLRVYTEWLYEGWVTFWVYKYDHILEVIQSTPQVPSTSFDHWVLGKLYGYDEVAIEEFVSSKNS